MVQWANTGGGVEPVAGRLVTITVDLPAQSDADGEALLNAALMAMRRANPGG
jgi:hypothetical protein